MLMLERLIRYFWTCTMLFDSTCTMLLLESMLLLERSMLEPCYCWNLYHVNVGTVPCSMLLLEPVPCYCWNLYHVIVRTCTMLLLELVPC